MLFHQTCIATEICSKFLCMMIEASDGKKYDTVISQFSAYADN